MAEEGLFGAELIRNVTGFMGDLDIFVTYYYNLLSIQFNC